MKTKRPSEKGQKKGKRPKDIWNSVRRLEGFLKKADIHANILLDSLGVLRAAVDFEVRKEIVRGLCNSVNGDILHALLGHKKRMDEGKYGDNFEQNAILTGVLDTLTQVLDLKPARAEGERIFIRKDSAAEFTFEEYPGAMDNPDLGKFEIEVLRCGWKVKGKVVIKPVVFEKINETVSISEGGDDAARELSAKA
ncbi:MAG: hypothetical protein HZA17_13865 [Nitrospirae bacterium]|nr:hypothetical protein [Nitrospirota bacterium]